MKIVIDTSVYVDFLRTGKSLYTLLSSKNILSFSYTPTIVIMELYSGESASNAKILEQIKRIVSPTKIMDLTRQLSEKAGDLLRNKLIRDPEDAIIAATALYLDAELVTLNRKHFTKVKGLKFFELQSDHKPQKSSV